MIRRVRTLFVAALLVAAPIASHAAMAPYTGTFEGLVIGNSAALSGDGWLVFGNVYSPDHATYYYGYGPYPAPNNSGGFSAVAAGQGGVDQGTQQLSVYNDYNNLGAHNAGNQVEANVYHEQTIGAADVGTWTFQFDAKLGNLVAPSTALAFIKTLNPSAGYATTNFVQADMTTIPAVWNTYTLTLKIDASLVGQLFQFGFANTASNYVASGVFYDNVVVTQTAGVGDLPGGAHALALAPASPNPFPGSTRLDFSLPQQGAADVSVYDVAGRHVATLFHGIAAAGPHVATWDGHFASGQIAPAGVYHGVLQTAAGTVTRKMVLTH